VQDTENRIRWKEEGEYEEKQEAGKKGGEGKPNGKEEEAERRIRQRRNMKDREASEEGEGEDGEKKARSCSPLCKVTNSLLHKI
jgi:hypothetical protein